MLLVTDRLAMDPVHEINKQEPGRNCMKVEPLWAVLLFRF